MNYASDTRPQEAHFALKSHFLQASKPLTRAFCYGIALVESAGVATSAFSAEIALVGSLKAPDESVFGLLRSCRGRGILQSMSWSCRVWLRVRAGSKNQSVFGDGVGVKEHHGIHWPICDFPLNTDFTGIGQDEAGGDSVILDLQ